MRELLCRDSHSRWGDVTDSNDPNQCQNRIVMRIRLLEEFSSLAKTFLLYYAVYHIGGSRGGTKGKKTTQKRKKNSLNNPERFIGGKKRLEMCKPGSDVDFCLL